MNLGSSLGSLNEGEGRLIEEKILGISDSGVVTPRCKLIPLKVLIFIWRLSMVNSQFRSTLTILGLISTECYDQMRIGG